MKLEQPRFQPRFLPVLPFRTSTAEMWLPRASASPPCRAAPDVPCLLHASHEVMTCPPEVPRGSSGRPCAPAPPGTPPVAPLSSPPTTTIGPVTCGVSPAWRRSTHRTLESLAVPTRVILRARRDQQALPPRSSRPRASHRIPPVEGQAATIEGIDNCAEPVRLQRRPIRELARDPGQNPGVRSACCRRLPAGAIRSSSNVDSPHRHAAASLPGPARRSRGRTPSARALAQPDRLREPRLVGLRSSIRCAHATTGVSASPTPECAQQPPHLRSSEVEPREQHPVLARSRTWNVSREYREPITRRPTKLPDSRISCRRAMNAGTRRPISRGIARAAPAARRHPVDSVVPRATARMTTAARSARHLAREPPGAVDRRLRPIARHAEDLDDPLRPRRRGSRGRRLDQDLRPRAVRLRPNSGRDPDCAASSVGKAFSGSSRATMIGSGWFRPQAGCSGRSGFWGSARRDQRMNLRLQEDRVGPAASRSSEPVEWRLDSDPAANLLPPDPGGPSLPENHDECPILFPLPPCWRFPRPARAGFNPSGRLPRREITPRFSRSTCASEARVRLSCCCTVTARRATWAPPAADPRAITPSSCRIP